MKRTQNQSILGWSLLLAAMSLLMIQPILASDTFKPVYKPTMKVSLTSSPIKVDGLLNESVWKNAFRADDFVERAPGDMIEPLVKTEVMVTYDESNLFAAFICHDDPSLIRATMSQRDQFSGNDEVIVLLDTYGDATWAYEFLVNPYGVQKDRLWTSVQGEDAGFDLIWNSAALITDSGYQVEIAIPFASMRFPNKDVQSWRMDFWRNHPRESFHVYSWAAYDRNEQCWPCQWGTVDGISSVFPGKGFEVLPTVIASQFGGLSDYSDPASFANEDIDGEPSLGAKYSISSDVTVEAAYNPDFSQVEADADQIDVNTTIALFYPERRPFFQEGSDLFRTIFNSFYTRTVNDPDYVVKLTGRREGLSVGFMSALDKTTPYIIPLDERSITVNSGKSYVNVLRGLKSFGNNSNLGFIVSDRRFENKGYGTVIGLDGNIRLSSNYSVVGQFLQTFSKEPNKPELVDSLNNESFGLGKYDADLNGESFSGGGMIAQFRRRAQNWNFTLDYNHVSPTYRTETGYDPWVNYHSLSLYTTYNIYFENGLFERIAPHMYTDRRWTFDDELRWRNLNFALDGNLRFAQTYFNFFYGTGLATWSNIEFDNLWNLNFDLNSRPSNRINFELHVGHGLVVDQWVIEKGRETSINASLTLKPWDRLTIEPDVNFVKSINPATDHSFYRQFIARARFRYQVTRELSLRIVVQYNDLNRYSHDYYRERWNIDPLIAYQISPFSIFYAGTSYNYRNFTPDLKSKEWEMDSRQFFMKLQYLFQI